MKSTICGYSSCPRLVGRRCLRCERVEWLWFLRRMYQKARRNQARCATCGADTGREFRSTGKPHMCRKGR